MRQKAHDTLQQLVKDKGEAEKYKICIAGARYKSECTADLDKFTVWVDETYPTLLHMLKDDDGKDDEEARILKDEELQTKLDSLDPWLVWYRETGDPKHKMVSTLAP